MQKENYWSVWWVYGFRIRLCLKIKRLSKQIIMMKDYLIYSMREETWNIIIINECSDQNNKVKGKDIIFGSEAKSAEKLTNQITKRGWTKNLVMDTVDNPYTIRTSINRATGNSATVYYTKKGSYVIVDDVTKAVIQVGDNINPSTLVPDSSIVDSYIPK